jgi:hypothetical protein
MTLFRVDGTTRVYALFLGPSIGFPPSATQILLYKHKFEAVHAFEANFAP